MKNPSQIQQELDALIVEKEQCLALGAKQDALSRTVSMVQLSVTLGDAPASALRSAIADHEAAVNAFIRVRDLNDAIADTTNELAGAYAAEKRAVVMAVRGEYEEAFEKYAQLSKEVLAAYKSCFAISQRHAALTGNHNMLMEQYHSELNLPVLTREAERNSGFTTGQIAGVTR